MKENSIRSFIQLLGIPTFIIDEDTTIIALNEEACKLIKLPKSVVEGKKSWTAFVHPKDLETMKKYHYERRKSCHAPEKYYFTLVDSEKNYREILINVSMIPNSSRSIVTLIDVTELKHLTDKFERKTRCQQAIMHFTGEVLKGKRKNHYQFLLEKAVEIIPGAQAGSVLLRGKRGIFYYKAAVGYDFQQLSRVFFRENELAQGLAKDVVKVTDFSINETLDKERSSILKAFGKINEIKVMLSIPIVVQKETIGFFNLDNFEDVDAFDEEAVETAKIFAGQIGVVFERLNLEKKIKDQNKTMRFLSYHDPLTGLPNRRMLEEEAERILSSSNRSGKTVSVIYIDLMGFKKINDQYGHSTGDKVLSVVAKRLKKCMRKSDFVARLGGDEFVFLLPGTPARLAVKLIERVIEQIETPIIQEGKKLKISANAGIAEYPKDGGYFEKILRNADRAMYHAKFQKLTYCIFES